MTTKQEAAEAVRRAKLRLGLTWTQIAEAVGRPVVWTTAAVLGQHPMSAAEAQTIGLSEGEVNTVSARPRPTSATAE
jgi:cyanate lyase